MRTVIQLVAADQTAAGGGFSLLNLLILVAVVVVGWPVYRVVRKRLTRRRHERWAREGLLENEVFTSDNDPDLRRDPGDDSPRR